MANTNLDHLKPLSEETERDAPAPVLHALIAEYDNVDAVMHAARKVRDAGYQRFDVHTPFPIHGIDPVMGIRPTILPWIVLICGITGGTAGILLTHYTMGVTPTWTWMLESLKGYQFPISGKPFWSTPAYIPPIFEMTILFSAFGAVFGMYLLNRLPMLYNPLFKSERFRRATNDRFFVVIERRDAKFDRQATEELLKSTGPLAIEAVDE